MHAHAPSTLVRARRIHTLEGPPVDAMIVSGGRVLATGPAHDLQDHPGLRDVVSLDGVLLPGFNDAHAHPTMTAENLLHVDCSPELVPDREALVQRLRTAADGTPAGRWVRASRYDHEKSTGGTVLDRVDLDEAVADRPLLLIHVAAHWGVLNSAGLAAAGLSDNTPDPPGGFLGRDGAGKLTGVVYEQALFDLAYSSMARGDTVLPASPVSERLDGLEQALRMFHAAGITSMCDALCGPDDLALLQEARRTGRLSMRVSALVAHPHFDALREAGIGQGFGDEWLRIAGVKAFVDGACAGGNCLVDEPFEGTDDHGMQLIEADELFGLLERVAGGAGMVLAVHANGDRAIRLLLEAHERARHRGSSPLRHRIEHCTLVDDDIVRRIRDLELVAVPFGSYARFHGDKLVGYYGRDRLERMFAHRMLLDAGVPVAGSSDYPCGPFEPLAALASCVERLTPQGEPIGLSQRISIEEAVRLYTTGAAYASGEEDRKGTLTPGMLADWVELDRDPFEVEAAELASLSVRSTWVGGTNVFQSSR